MILKLLVQGLNICHVAAEVWDQFKFVCLHNLHQLFFSLAAKCRQNQLNLLGFVLTREQRLSQKHFCKDTACCPDINGCCVLGPACHDFGCAVPSRRDVIGEDSTRTLHHWIFAVPARRKYLGASQSKVANLQVTVLIQEQVAWFKIAV